MTRFTLTRKQSRLLYYIEGYIGEHGYSPSVRELAAMTGRNLNGTHYSLNAIAK